MLHKKVKKESYDKRNQIPVIRCSICTGERAAGFKDIHTGKFMEIMVIRSDKDMDEFMEKYDVPVNEIRKEW